MAHWLHAIIESTIIISSRYPSYMPSQLLRLLQQPQRDVSDIRVTPLWLSGYLLVVAGSLIRLSCYRNLGNLFTWDLAIKKEHKLVTSGPYSVVRHPSYTGSAMIGIGAVLYYFGKGSWFVSYGGLSMFWGRAFAVGWSALGLFVPVLLCSRVNVEDEVLRKQFGAEWETYARSTPYKLIPFAY